MTMSVPVLKRRLSCIEEEVDEIQWRRRCEVYTMMRRWISWAGEDDMLSFSKQVLFDRHLLLRFLFVKSCKWYCRI